MTTQTELERLMTEAEAAAEVYIAAICAADAAKAAYAKAVKAVEAAMAEDET